MNMPILTCILINGDKGYDYFFRSRKSNLLDNGVEVPSLVFEQILQRLFKNVAAKLHYELWLHSVFHTF